MCVFLRADRNPILGLGVSSCAWTAVFTVKTPSLVCQFPVTTPHRSSKRVLASLPLLYQMSLQPPGGFPSVLSQLHHSLPLTTFCYLLSGFSVAGLQSFGLRAPVHSYRLPGMTTWTCGHPVAICHSEN